MHYLLLFSCRFTFIIFDAATFIKVLYLYPLRLLILVMKFFHIKKLNFLLTNDVHCAIVRIVKMMYIVLTRKRLIKS